MNFCSIMYSASRLQRPLFANFFTIDHTPPKICTHTSLLLLCRYMIFSADIEGRNSLNYTFPIETNTKYAILCDVTISGPAVLRHDCAERVY